MRKGYITGNVVKLKEGYIVIIANVKGTDENPYFDWISFSASNVSGGDWWKTQHESDRCFDECGHICDDPECTRCNGTSHYTVTTYGMEEATYLANNVKEYIMKCLTKNFDF